MRWRVVCALREVIATCAPTSLLSSVDLPTLGRPDDRHGAGAKRLRRWTWRSWLRFARAASICASACAAASCSAARRLAPCRAPRCPGRPRGTPRVKVWSCASPSTAMHRVARQRELAALQVLLQRGLRILVHGLRAAASSSALGEQPLDRLAHRLEARVEVHRAQQRLERVGEDRGAAKAAALQLAFAQAQQLAQAQALRGLEERGLVHELRAQAREVAFGKLREAFVEERGDRAVEQAVAEEFEALVVRRAEAAVRERPARRCAGSAKRWPRPRSRRARPSGAQRAGGIYLAVVATKSRHAEKL